MIGARTKAALAAAKARGVKLGGPKLAQARKVALEAIAAAADNHAANALPVIREIRKAGATTLREIADALDAAGVQNGAGSREIRKKLDDIVAFAEVEKFLDTPVKRYSSGMYVRLAFAVAAQVLSLKF